MATRSSSPTELGCSPMLVCATGYRRGLESLVGHLGVLDERGRPRVVGHRPAAAGLRFIGYIPRPSQIGATAKQAKRAARAIAGELRRPAVSPASSSA